MELVSSLTTTRSSQIWRCQTEDGRIAVAKLVEANSRNLFELFVMTTIVHPHLASAISAQSAHQDDNMNKLLICVVSELAITDLALRVRSTSITLPVIWEWIRMILLGLHQLHANKIIHGDVKAKNIFLFGDNQVKLSDFGLSVFESTFIGTHSMCTYTHRPMEVWLKKELTTQLDMWSVGCTIFELLTGRSLFPMQETTNNSLRSRMLNCILHWVDSQGQVNEYGSLKSAIDFRPAIMPEYLNKPEYSKFKSMMLSCLKIEPHQRPTCSQLLTTYFGVSPIVMMPLALDQIRQRAIERVNQPKAVNNLVNLLTKRDVYPLTTEQLQVLTALDFSFK